MPRHPWAFALPAAALLLTVTACSSGGSDEPSKGDSTTPTKGSGTSTAKTTKLVRVKGNGGISNVIVKLPSGAKVSLSAAAPGHDVKEQMYDPDAKTWSEPTSVFKADTRYCHAIKAKSKETTIAATVTCSISAQDTAGTQSSYVLGSTDGKTWKRSDLDGASGKPIMSPTGKYVAWSTPSQFLIWKPGGEFTHVKYTQDANSPTIGLMQDTGALLMVKATPGKKETCSYVFRQATASAPAWKTVSTTLPQSGHPECVAKSAKLQGGNVIANFEQTVKTKVDGKKSEKTSVYAIAFKKLPSGKWVISQS